MKSDLGKGTGPDAIVSVLSHEGNDTRYRLVLSYTSGVALSVGWIYGDLRGKVIDWCFSTPLG